MRVQLSENFGDVEGMDEHVTLALAGFRETGDRWGIAMSLTALGGLLLISDDAAGALAAHEEALRLTTELIPRSRDNADGLLHLARVHVRLGEYDQAHELIARARAAAEGSGSPHHLAMVEVTAAQLAQLEGDLVEARRSSHAC